MLEPLKEALKTIPDTPGVYQMLNAAGEVMYIGKARSLVKRVSSYTQIDRLPERLQRMVVQITAVEVVSTPTEVDALLLEASMIKLYSPKYNILLKDGKSYPYILIAKDHPFPRITKYRGQKDKNGAYFGPFSSVSLVDYTISFIQRAFMIRPCEDSFFAARTRPCLQYQIKRCTAPCVGNVNEAEYGEQVKMTERYLSGQSREIQNLLTTKMEEHSRNLQFEEAAKYRDRIKALTMLQTFQRMKISLEDGDVAALARQGAKSCIQLFSFRAGLNYGNKAFFPEHGEDCEDAEVMEAFLGRYYQDTDPPKEIIISHEFPEVSLMEDALSKKAGFKVKITRPLKGNKFDALSLALTNAVNALERKALEASSQKQALEDVAKVFNLPHPVERIEVFDNSHIMGTNQVGAMIVAGLDGFIKSQYRRYNIREALESDDYGMMREVFRRRFRRSKEVHIESLDEAAEVSVTKTLPDLILIDGGLGQLNAAAEVFAELGVDIPFAAIAKGENRNAGEETFFMPGRVPFKLPKNSPTLFYLQRLRDEAHRYAIQSHRNKRAKGVTDSSLNDIPGIGAVRRRALIKFFGSVKLIREADIDELCRAPGISRKTAEEIYGYFR